ncbi:MAG: hypothetical protein SA339_05095 [Methanomassiliicoccus sp.]|nr:hypothetical protein [Methanomassiliicoccus sp.]
MVELMDAITAIVGIAISIGGISLYGSVWEWIIPTIEIKYREPISKKKSTEDDCHCNPPSTKSTGNPSNFKITCPTPDIENTDSSNGINYDEDTDTIYAPSDKEIDLTFAIRNVGKRSLWVLCLLEKRTALTDISIMVYCSENIQKLSTQRHNATNNVVFNHFDKGDFLYKQMLSPQSINFLQDYYEFKMAFCKYVLLKINSDKFKKFLNPFEKNPQCINPHFNRQGNSKPNIIKKILRWSIRPWSLKKKSLQEDQETKPVGAQHIKPLNESILKKPIRWIRGRPRYRRFKLHERRVNDKSREKICWHYIYIPDPSERRPPVITSLRYMEEERFKIHLTTPRVEQSTEYSIYFDIASNEGVLQPYEVILMVNPIRKVKTH